MKPGGSGAGFPCAGDRSRAGALQSRNKQEARSMSRDLVAHNKPVFDQLHPKVYGAAVGLVAWFALMAWVLFDRNVDTKLVLMFMTVLFVVAVTLPWTMSLVWRKYQMPHEQHLQQVSLHDWRVGDFAVWGAKIRGTHAAIDVLLPLIAVSAGLTAIGIVFVIVRAFALP
jgi:hypothetical protein